MNVEQGQPTSYVTADGTYGEGDLLVFHSDALTNEQWEFMSEMRDNDRFGYTKAVLDGDLDTVAWYHNDYEEPAPTDGYYGEGRTLDYGTDTPNIREHN